ncbi:hypothetical protein [Tychonema sp. LEGE 06208]|uniref:hypothetical protein n=1 Tax=Tychonema sp. LEGE 06208 TaxID=1828663 RepID=UPI00187FDB77|nr:hypothetical protein [Tychonema sp. LEGE 06208]MBE9163114.1 hypothetical protein [Tychonema sp. LEGE 06208]
MVSGTAFKLYWAIGRHIKKPQILKSSPPLPLSPDPSPHIPLSRADYQEKY